MFNSVAKYLWGGVTETEDTNNENELRQEESEGAPSVPDAALVEDDEWILVGGPGQDKENRVESAPHGHHHHHHSNPPHQHITGDQPHATTATDTELDDAASLAHHLSNPAPLQDCAYQNQGEDSNYSSDTESGRDSGLRPSRPSSPESVLSACSGRSHATYKPRGRASEPWLVTPAPCFTGSQVGELSPIASSPLENLLIEHPSMSVYLSIPQSSLPASHPFLSTITDGAPLGEDTEGPSVDRTMEEVQPADETAIQPRQRANNTAVHFNQNTPEILLKKTHSAQKVKRITEQKSISKEKCKRQNRVLETQAIPKHVSKRNRKLNPSGCKASRFSQRT